MAITWGSVDNGLRVGTEVSMSPSTVTASTASVKITVDYYVGSYVYGWNDEQKLTLSGAATGSWTYDMVTDYGSTTSKKIGSKTITVNLSYSGSQTKTFGAKVSGASNGATPSVSRSVTVPARPISAPKTPTGFSATRTSDTNANLKWTNNTSATASGTPYDYVEVQRWSHTSDSWSAVSKDNWTGQTTDTAALSANNRFRFRIRAGNSAGVSEWEYSAYVVTTPTAPTAATVARASDTQMNVSWTLSSSGYRTGVLLERWTEASNKWTQIASLSASATSYSDKTTSANNNYQYRVRAHNGRYSGYATSSKASTTPAKPSTAPTATRTGNNVKVSWTNPTLTSVSGVEVWIVTNGVLATSRAVLLPKGSTTWTHSSLNVSSTYAYAIKFQGGDDSGDASPVMTSPLSDYSQTILLLQPPAAPTKLTPNGSAFDVTRPVQFSWQHSTLDGSDQTAYEIQYRSVGSSSWTSTGKITSTLGSATLDLSAQSVPAVMEWSVRTYGDYTGSPAYSPWSSSGTFTLSSVPAAVISYPEDGVPISDATARVEWSFSDADGSVQTAWKATLYDAGMQVLDSLQADGDASEHTFDYALADLQTYTFGVVVWDEHGLPSEEVVQTFSVAHDEPRTPDVDAEWISEEGSTNISISNPTPRSFAWSGVVNKSTSTKTEDGEEPLTNLYTDPCLRDLGSYYDVYRNIVLNPRGLTVGGSVASTWQRNALANVVSMTGSGLPAGYPDTFVRATTASTTSAGFYFAVLPNATLSTRYFMSVYVRAHAPGGTLRLSIEGNAVTSPPVHTPVALPAGEWVLVSREYSTPSAWNASATTLTFSAYTNGLPTGTTVDFAAAYMGTREEYFDDLSVVPDYTAVTSTAGNAVTFLRATQVLSITGVRPIRVAHWSDPSKHAIRITSSAPTTTATDTFSAVGGDIGAMRLGMVAGKTYTVAVKAFLRAPLKGTLGALSRKVVLYYKTAAAGYPTIASDPIPNEVGEHTLRFTFTVPIAAVEAFIRIYLGASVGNGEMDWADFIIAEGVHPDLEFFSGDTPDEVEAVSNKVYRSYGAEDQWELIADDVPVDGAVTDHIPPLSQEVRYKVQAVSSIPSSKDSEIVSVTTDNPHHWVYVNAGQGFGEKVRFRDNATIDVTAGSQKVNRSFAGRVKPVEFSGIHQVRSIAVSARLAPDSSTIEEIEALAMLPAPACIRASRRRFIVSMGDVSSNEVGVTTEISWGMTEVDSHAV